MSSIAPFVVGLIASGAGYAYLSRDLVTSRNELMMKYFKADGVEPYYPGAKVRTRKHSRGRLQQLQMYSSNPIDNLFVYVRARILFSTISDLNTVL